MPFVRLCLDLTEEVISGVRPWFTILIEKSVELWSDSFQWLLWGAEEVTRPGLRRDCRRAFELKQSAYHCWCRNRSAVNWDLFCQAWGTANRLYAAANSRTLMTVPLRMPGGVHQKVMCLVRSLIFLPFVRLVVLLFLIKRGRLSCWVRGLTANSHETLLSYRRPVTLGLHSVALPLEHMKLTGTCWILIRMVEWTRVVASLCSFGTLLLFLLQNWVVFFVNCYVVVSFRKSGRL